MSRANDYFRTNDLLWLYYAYIVIYLVPQILWLLAWDTQEKQ